MREDNAALLQHRDARPDIRHPGKWTVPGGHCETGETLEACALREVAEETGYKCGELRLLSAFRFDDGDGEPYQLALFWTGYDVTQNYECFEGQNLTFLKREDISAYPFLEFLLPYWDLAIASKFKLRYTAL